MKYTSRILMGCFVLVLGCAQKDKAQNLSTDQIDFDRYSQTAVGKPVGLDPNGIEAARWGYLANSDSPETEPHKNQGQLPIFATNEFMLPYILYANIRNIVQTGNVEGKDLSKVLSQELLGDCYYKSNDGASLSTPCLRVEVLLKEDKNSEVIASTWTNQEGRFRFSIPKNKKYFVSVKDGKGRTSELPVQAGGGQFVSLGLKP